MRKTVQLSFVVLLVFFCAGCATNRGIIDLRAPLATNPSDGPVVKIIAVNDLRQFELRPQVASTPSLKDGQIGNKTVTSRAIARKRNGYGKALGDILLPEGRSVADLVKGSAQKALQERGYIVVEKDSPRYATALPLELDVHQFWAWVNMGFWSLELEFEGIINTRNSDIFINSRDKIRGHVSLKTQAAGTRAWTNILTQGLDELGVQIKRNIKNPKTKIGQINAITNAPLSSEIQTEILAIQSEGSISEKLKMIERMRTDGVLTEGEYLQKRKNLIDGF